MEQRVLNNEYRDYFFIKSELESHLGFKLTKEDELLPDYLKPYRTRIGIQLREAANILAGFKPSELTNISSDLDIINGYKKSLWDAVDNGVLTGVNEETEYDFNEEHRVDITLMKDEVTAWAKKYKFSWPFSIESHEKNENEEKRDLADLTNELRKENEHLKKEIESLKANLPSLLGKYTDHDPLLLAINIRNEEWLSYDEDVRGSAPTADYIIAKLRQNHGISSNALAAAIEKVACPIKRK